MREFARISFSDANGRYHYILCWELLSQDKNTNKSRIRITAIIQVETPGGTISFSRRDAWIEGTHFTPPYTCRYLNTTIGSVDYDCTHDGNGNWSGTFSGGISTSWLMNGTLSGTITLPQIPRPQPQVQPTKITSFYYSDLTTEKVKFNYQFDSTVDRIEYQLNSSSWIQTYPTSDHTGGTTGGYRTIYLNPNTSYNLRIRVRKKGTNVWTTSNYLYFTTPAIPTRVRVGGSWRQATPYVRVSDSWRKAEPYVRVNGSWRRCN